MSWLTILAPLPKPPWSWRDLPHVGPYALLDDIVRTFTEVQEPETQREARDPETGEQSGFTGSQGVGYRWTEVECPETSAIPATRQACTVGIDGLELIWHWAAPKLGQAGYAGFSHRALWVRFDGPVTRTRFCTLWAARFGGEPTFVDAEMPPR